MVKKIVYGLLALLALVSFVYWTNDHDAKVAKATERYELCVINTFGINPSAYYDQYGQWPVCE